MAIEKWVAGAVSSYTSIMSTDLNSLASGNALLNAADLDNSTALDMFADFSLLLASLACVAPNFCGLFLYPRHDDATHYGDGRFGSTAAMSDTNAPVPFWIGNFPLVVATQIEYAEITRVPIPPGIFRVVLWNRAGVNFAASGNTLKWRTWNRAIS